MHIQIKCCIKSLLCFLTMNPICTQLCITHPLDTYGIPIQLIHPDPMVVFDAVSGSCNKFKHIFHHLCAHSTFSLTPSAPSTYPSPLLQLLLPSLGRGSDHTCHHQQI